MSLALLNNIALKVSGLQGRFSQFAQASLRRIPLSEGKKPGLDFIKRYGSTPTERANKVYIGDWPLKFFDDLAYIPVTLLKEAEVSGKYDLTKPFGAFVCDDAGGHSNNLCVSVPLKPGRAKQLISSSSALLELMLCFPTGTTFLTRDMALELVGLNPFERVLWYAKNVDAIRQQHEAIRSGKEPIDSFAALLGVDLVFIRHHRLADTTTGLKEQSWVAGTSGAHGLSGTLTWRLVWDPNQPDNLIIQFHGEGQSYAQFVDDTNNLFAQYGLPMLVEKFKHKIDNGLEGQTDAKVAEHIQQHNLDLSDRLWLLTTFMPQRSAQLLNLIWASPTQFNSAKIEEERKKREKALVVRATSDLVISWIADKSTSLPDIVKKQKSTEEAILSGVYDGEKRIEDGSAQELFVPEEDIATRY